ncbi:unnamed protein product, partial [marine sediment metagenome]
MLNPEKAIKGMILALASTKQFNRGRQQRDVGVSLEKPSKIILAFFLKAAENYFNIL